MASEQEIEDFFDDAGGQGAPSFKFAEIGDGVQGEIVSMKKGVVTDPQTKQPKLDKNNNEQPQLAIVLQTDLRDWSKVSKVPKDQDGKELPTSDDTGLRAIYSKHQMTRAIKDALVAAGVRAPEVGGKLAVKYAKDQEIGQMNPLKNYEARYKAPAPKTDGDGFFNEGEQQQAAPSSQASAPASAPAGDDEPPF